MAKTVLNSHSKSTLSQIPDLGPRTGGLNENHSKGGLNEDDREGGLSGDDRENVTLKSLSVAASSPNIQKHHNKEFIVYAGM
jgi:hypothetical protein